MPSRSFGCLRLIAGLAFISIAVRALAIDPAYLSEMPTVERVKREIQGTDAQGTALRQIGAFWQLQEIIRTLAARRDPDQLTPDERRLMQAYYEASYYVSQAVENALTTEDEKRRWRIRSPYRFARTDPRFGVEELDLFKRFFSPAFRAAFDRANGAEEAQQRARAQSEKKAFEIAKANDAAAQARAGAVDPGTLAMRRCIAAGRSLFECLAEVMENQTTELAGIIDPSANKEVPPGLRMAGDYPGQGGFGITLNPGSATDPGSAAVTCGKLVPESHAYTVEMKNSQVVVTVQNDPMPLVLTFRPDGTLAGPGPIDIKGKVIIGYSTRQTTQNKPIQEYEAPQYSPHALSRVGGILYADVPVTVTVPNYAPKTERCSIGVLKASGPVEHPPVGVPKFLLPVDPTVTKLPPSPAGLRMGGTYANAGGLNVEFRPGFALVGCRDVAVVRIYTVAKQESQVVVTIQNDTAPIGLALRADGSLTGASGPVQVAGRVLAGIGADNQVAFAPKTENCALGTLTPAKQPQGEAAAGAAAARATINTAAPSGPNNVSTPAKPAGPAGTAVLSVVNGFAAQGGAANPLAGVFFFLMKESLETALTKAGFRPPQGMSAIRSWVAACNNGQPVCGQAIQASASSAAAFIKADATGRAQLAAVPAGTYYLFVLTRYNNQPILWNLRVDLGPGANSVTLDQRNAARIE
jgi:hypothetical protein